MSHARFEAACATLLAGTMGGDDGTGAIGTAEIFDPSPKPGRLPAGQCVGLGIPLAASLAMTPLCRVLRSGGQNRECRVDNERYGWRIARFAERGGTAVPEPSSAVLFRHRHSVGPTRGKARILAPLGCLIEFQFLR